MADAVATKNLDSNVNKVQSWLYTIHRSPTVAAGSPIGTQPYWHMLERADHHAEKYIGSGRLNWPEGATIRESIRAVLNLPQSLALSCSFFRRYHKWIKHLPCLEEVYLVNCDSILELATDEDEEETLSSDVASFPRLKLLGLSHLTKLKNIRDTTLITVSLQRLLVCKCPMLVKLPSRILKVDHAPLILGQQYWWDQIVWDDSSTKSTLFSFFR